MKNKLFITSLICLLLIFTLGITAFADDEVPAETTALEVVNEAEEVFADETAPANLEDVEETVKNLTENQMDVKVTDLNNASEAETKDADEEAEEIPQQEAAVESADDNSEEIPQQEPTVESADDNSEEKIEDVQISDQATSGGSYLLKFSVFGADGNKCEFKGGTEEGISIVEILKALEIDVKEDSKIEYVEDSVDTEVIGIRESEDGLYITDNGHFAKASKNLIINVDGEEIVIEIKDDYDFYVHGDEGIDDDSRSGDASQPFKTVRYAVSRANGATKITLLTDIEENQGTQIVISSGKNITLELNGYRLTTAMAYVKKEYGIKINAGAELNVINSGYSKYSGIRTDAELDALIVSLGTLTIDAGYGTIEGNKKNCGIRVDGGTFKMTGGTITSCKTAVKVNGSASFIMTGGTISNNIEGGVVLSGTTASFNMTGGTISENTSSSEGGGVTLSGEDSTFTMTGGTISGNTASVNGGGVYVNTGKLILGGTANVTGNKKSDGNANNVTFSDGAKPIKVSEEVKPLSTMLIGINSTKNEGKVTENGGKYINQFTTDSQTKIVHRVKNDTEDYIYLKSIDEGTSLYNINNGKQYSADNFQNAINEAEAGDTLRLVKDTIANITVGTEENPKKIILDLNGSVLDGNNNNNVISVSSGSELTIVDSRPNNKHESPYNELPAGGVITKGRAEKGGGIYNKGTLTIEGGTITGNTSTAEGGGVYSTKNITVGGTANITGNKNGTADNNLYLAEGQLVIVKPGYKGKVGVTSAKTPTSESPVNVTYSYDNDYSSYFDSDNSSFCIIRFFSEGKYTVQLVETYHFYVNATDGKDEDTVTGSESDPFKTIQYAIERTGEVTTEITMLTDNSAEQISIGNYEGTLHRKITLNINGKTLTFVKTTGMVACAIKVERNAELTICDRSTEEKGVITMEKNQVYIYAFLSVSDGGTCTLNSGTLRGDDSESGVSAVGTFIMNGGTITNFGSLESITGATRISGEFIMTGGTITNNKAVSGAGVDFDGKGKFIMTGGTITGNTSKVYGGGVFVGDGDLTLGGMANITGNYNSSGAETNVTVAFYSSSVLFTISEEVKPSETMHIGINTMSGVGKITYNGGEYIDRFYSDYDSYIVYRSKNDSTHEDYIVLQKIVSPDEIRLYNINNGKQYSADNFQNAINEAEAGDTLRLVKDTIANITVGTLENPKNIILDLNGSVLDGNNNNNVISVSSGSELTIVDSRPNNKHVNPYNKLPAGGVITKGSSEKGGGIYNEGTLTIEGGTITGNTSTENGGGVYSNNDITVGGTANITGNKNGTADNNLYLGEGQIVNVNSGYKGKIGVTSAKAPTSGNPVNLTAPEDVDYSSNFTSDSIIYSIATYSSGEKFTVQLIAKTEPVPEQPQMPQTVDVVVVEPVNLGALTKEQQTRISETLEAKNLNLVAVVKVYVLSNGNRINKGRAAFEINSSILEGYDARSLRAWKLNDDNTMTEVTFEIIDGKICFNNGELGIYVLTA